MPSDHSIYLCAPVNALVEGIYEENVPFSEIRKHGDFGLGTFNDLDGEMVMIDGVIYQMKADGTVSTVSDEVLTPFSCVTFFEPLTHDDLPGSVDYDAFVEWIQRLLPSENIFYAIRFEGLFSAIKTRTVPKQHNYRPLVEVAKEQPVFDFNDIEGTLAGFFTPKFMASINVPGFHLHFLSADKRHGGHLLDCHPVKGRISIQFLHRLELGLPMTVDYLTLDFDRDIESDLDQAEK